MNLLRRIREWIRPPLPEAIVEQGKEHTRVIRRADRALTEAKRLELVRDGAHRAGRRMGR